MDLETELMEAARKVDSNLATQMGICKIFRPILRDRDADYGILHADNVEHLGTIRVLLSDIAEHERLAREFVDHVNGLNKQIAEQDASIGDLRQTNRRWAKKSESHGEETDEWEAQFQAKLQQVADLDAELLGARGGLAEAKRQLAGGKIIERKLMEQLDKSKENEQRWKRLSQEQAGRILVLDETIMALRSKLQRPTFDGTATT